MRPRKVRLASRRGRRSSTETARVYGSDERIVWMQGHPCLACGRYPSEVAHTANGGMSRKADASNTVPLCAEHHREQHRVGIKSFQARHAYMLSHLTLVEWAAWYEAAWRRHAGLEPIASILPRALAELSEGDAE